MVYKYFPEVFDSLILIGGTLFCAIIISFFIPIKGENFG